MPHDLFFSPWKNARDMSTQYCYDYELALIRLHGSAFDEEYKYWIVKDIIKRFPLWMHGKRIPAEKYKKHYFDKQLTFCLH